MITQANEKKSQPDKKADKRWRLVDSTIRKNGGTAHALIEALHTVQSAFGFIDEEAMKHVAHALKVPLSKVYGVATFYHFFKLKPQGKHSCVVCTGTACYIKGASKLLSELENQYGVKPGQTTDDNELSVLTARCIGSCGLAPAVVIDNEVAGRVEPSDMTERLERCIQNDA